MKRVLHGLVLLAIVLALFAAPYRAFIGPIRLGSLFGGGVDAVSSASVILDAPSGSYVVLLNEARHQRYDTSDQWERFFKGESLVIMDDVVCGVMEADAGGRQMADSYRSRLPENQMKVRAEDALMLLSRAQAGGFDVIVMSREFADAYRADTVCGLEGVRVIEVDRSAGEVAA